MAQLDDARLARVEAGEPLECLVEGEQVGGRRLDSYARFVERYGVASRSALDRMMRAGVLDENLAHRPGGDPEQMGAVFDGWQGPAEETEIGLVHQTGRLERVTRSLPSHGPASHRLQVVVDEREEAVNGFRIAGPRAWQEACDRLGVGHRAIIADLDGR